MAEYKHLNKNGLSKLWSKITAKLDDKITDPGGGTEGQVLTKTSSGVTWKDAYQGSPIPGRELNTYSWVDLYSMLYNDEYTKDDFSYMVGQTKTLELNGGGFSNNEVMLIGLEQDEIGDTAATSESISSTGASTGVKVKATFMCCNSIMHTAGTADGWSGSSTRSTVLNTNFYNALPDDLKQHIKTVVKRWNMTGNATNNVIRYTHDKIFLPSHSELGITLEVNDSAQVNQFGSCYEAFSGGTVPDGLNVKAVNYTSKNMGYLRTTHLVLDRVSSGRPYVDWWVAGFSHFGKNLSNSRWLVDFRDGYNTQGNSYVAEGELFPCFCI